MVLLISTLAAAASLVGGVSADGSVQSPSRHLGLGGMFGVRLAPRWSLEATAEGRASWEAPALLASRAELRWTRSDLSALIGGGAGWSPETGAAPQLSLGLALDSPAGLRTQARYLHTFQGEPAVLVGLGVAWPRPEKPELVVVPQPEPEPEPEIDIAGRITGPEVVMVWVPHPICAWVPASEAAALLATLPPSQQVRVSADGYLPQTISLDDETPVELIPVPPQGSIIIAAGVGDVVTLLHEASEEPMRIALNAEGNGIATIAEGEFTLTISGAGREVGQRGYITDGFVTWFAAPLPEEVSVGFPSGSSRLDGAARREIARLLAAPGEWAYQIWGSSSPEGSQAVNDSLAAERAESVAEALRAGGLSPEQVIVLPPSTRPIDSTERAAHIIPVPAGGAQ